MTIFNLILQFGTKRMTILRTNNILILPLQQQHTENRIYLYLFAL